MPDRRPLVAVAAAALVTVAVTALVVAFGVRRLPELPAVTDPPPLTPPGTIAYVSAQDGAEQCVHVLPAAGGQDLVVHCSGESDLDWIHEIAWTPGGDLAISGSGRFGDSAVVVVDIRGGKARGSRIVQRPGGSVPLQAESRRTRADGAELVVDSQDGTARVAVRRDGDVGPDILALAGPRDYHFADAQWSPDGEWIVVADGDGRLLLAPAAGGDARLLQTTTAGAGYAGNVAWFIPGTRTYTVDV